MIRWLLCLGCVLLTACGGGSDSDSGGSGGVSPSGYSISGLTNPVDINNQNNVGFSLSNAEVGSEYRYSFTDSQNGQISGYGTIYQTDQAITGIDLSSLVDGSIRLEFALQNSATAIGPVLTATTNKETESQVSQVTLSGQITYDRVPHNLDGIGLDYSNTMQLPVRQASLRILDASGDILAISKTDEQGLYQVLVPVDTELRVEVLAELFEADPELNWLTRVVDSANNDSLFVLQGALASSGNQNQQRNLRAASGWDGIEYSGTRSAAPFAILDSIYEIFERLRTEEISVSLPELQIRWSTESTGSFYQNGDPYISIAGLADVDTDEYDPHVIVHEWLHYYEDQISRGDTIGGSHSLNSLLEPRTAYSEGKGNAWAAIILEDPVYKDALGAGQAIGFNFNMESSVSGRSGWYIERSVQEIVYDLVDLNNEGMDDLSLSLAELLSAWQSDDYLEQNSITTIFSFLELLMQRHPQQASAIEDLMLNENISGQGLFAVGETNGSDRDYSLPVYHQLSVGATSMEICSDNAADGEYNRLENRQLVRFTIDAEGSYRIEMDRNLGTSHYDVARDSDPDFIIFRQGKPVTSYVLGEGASADSNNESFVASFTAGEYVLEAFDWFNIDEDSDTGGLTCFDLSILPI